MTGSEVEEDGICKVTFEDSRRPVSPFVECIDELVPEAALENSLEQLDPRRRSAGDGVQLDHQLFTFLKRRVQGEEKRDHQRRDTNTGGALEQDHQPRANPAR